METLARDHSREKPKEFVEPQVIMETLARDHSREKPKEFVEPQETGTKQFGRATMNRMVGSLLNIMRRDGDFATHLKATAAAETASFETWEKDDVREPTTKRRKVGDSQFAEEQEPADDKRRRSRIPFKKLRFIPKGLKLDGGGSVKIADKLRRRNMQNLLREKKLMLILDLDHTLVNSSAVGGLSSKERYLLDDPNKSLFVWDDFVTKLRPYAHAFLREASRMFDLYIYTMGSRPYATRMAGFLDPHGVYFRSKVISREDSTTPNRKGLDVVLGEERAVVILDDNQGVWGRHKESLIVVERYNFFASSHRICGSGGDSLSELKKDEEELDGALATTLPVLRRMHRMFFDSPGNDVRKVLLKMRDEARQGSGMDVEDKLKDQQHWQVDVV